MAICAHGMSWGNKGELAIFDLDDSGLGLPIQDLITALNCLDTSEQEAALLQGYASIRPIPEHIALIPEYHVETPRRLYAWSTP
jgi:Ser/Thr protein kinase RdoA (MazF antagonist)